MTEKIDLKSLERKAYLAYHDDGLLDMGIGAVLAWLGFITLTDLGVPFYLWYILFVSSWTAAKRKVTVPRVGYVKFRETRRDRVQRLMLVIALVLTATMVAGVLGFKSVDSGGPPAWMLAVLDYLDIIFGAVLLGGGLVSLGYTTEIRRFTQYGVAAFTLHTANHFITVNPVWDVWQSMAPVNLLLGTVMLGNGYMLLRRFKEKYPLTGEPENE
jgi:hypothetical protein